MTRRMLRRTTLLITVLAIALAAGSGTVLRANRGYSSQLVFYSSSTMQSVVGEGYVDCQWHSSQQWGSTTNWYTSYDDTCDGSVTPWFGCLALNQPYCPYSWSCNGGICSGPDGSCTPGSNQCYPSAICAADGICH